MQNGLENMKIIMDEASQQSLDVLRGNLSELLNPLKELSGFNEKLEGIKEEISDFSNDTKRKINDLEDAMDISQLRRDMKKLLDGQAVLAQKLDAISKNLEGFQASFAQIDWDSPIDKSSK